MGVVSGVRTRSAAYFSRVKAELKASFSQDHSPEQIARSFAIGVFITMLPTLGAGLIVFVLLSYLFRWINKVALFASVVVLNPAVKWGVYAGSLTLGVIILGPVDGLDTASFSLDAGGDVLLRLLVGNLILAILATAIGYVAVYRMVIAYRDRETSLVADAVDSVYEEFPELGESDTTTDNESQSETASENQPETDTADQSAAETRRDEPTTDD